MKSLITLATQEDHRSRNHSLKYSKGALHGHVSLVHFDEVDPQPPPQQLQQQQQLQNKPSPLAQQKCSPNPQQQQQQLPNKQPTVSQAGVYYNPPQQQLKQPPDVQNNRPQQLVGNRSPDQLQQQQQQKLQQQQLQQKLLHQQQLQQQKLPYTVQQPYIPNKQPPESSSQVQQHLQPGELPIQGVPKSPQMIPKPTTQPQTLPLPKSILQQPSVQAKKPEFVSKPASPILDRKSGEVITQHKSDGIWIYDDR
jgi:hypothetical protein